MWGLKVSEAMTVGPVQHENQNVRNSKPTKSVLAPRPCPWALSLSKLWGCPKVELVTKTVSQSDMVFVTSSAFVTHHTVAVTVTRPLFFVLCSRCRIFVTSSAFRSSNARPWQAADHSAMIFTSWKCFIVWNLFSSLAVGLKGMQASFSQIFSHHIDKWDPHHPWRKFRRDPH